MSDWISIKQGLKLPRYDSPPYLEGDWAVASDLHIPNISPLWVSRLVSKAKEHGVDQLLLAGDIYNFDSVSSYINDSRVLLDDELDVGDALLEELHGHFRNMQAFMTNHELRLWRKVEGAVTRSRLGKWIFPDFVKFGIHAYAELEHNIRVTHPRNYSQIPGRIATRLADRYQANVISAHGHLCGGPYPSHSGAFWGIDSGGLFDEKELAYRMLYDSTFPAWQNGFVIIDGGYPYVYSVFNKWEE